ncbi:MAG: hypothetical protein ABJN57_13415 [Hyphomicrobiales bacterium]
MALRIAVRENKTLTLRKKELSPFRAEGHDAMGVRRKRRLSEA